MHEMGIAQQIVQIAVDSIPEDLAGSKISSVNVEIGTMSSIVSESLSFCFDIASKNTLCSEAELIIEKTPAVMSCKNCNTEWEINEPTFNCLKCQNTDIELTKQCEIDILSIDID